MNKIKNYQHIISLGFYCSVASELEKIGLRDCSNPFDWLISDFQSVINLIDSDFINFLDSESMQQYSNNASYYVNTNYNIHFYHDFDKYKSFQSQIDSIQSKYKNRIDKFYKNIQEPTLFIRYIKDQKECDFIESKSIEILSILRKHNSLNDIIFISNDTVFSQSLNVFKVPIDDNDSVAREFLRKSNKLKTYLCSDIYDPKNRKTNYTRYKKKYFRNALLKYPQKCMRVFKKIFYKVNIHDQIYYLSN